MIEGTGLLDTSVIIDLDYLSEDKLPSQILISSLSLAELVTGISNLVDDVERKVRVGTISKIRSSGCIVPFDEDCAMAFELIADAVIAYGRKPRGKRALDYLIVTTAAHYKVPLYTRNAKDFEGLDGLVEIVSV